MHLNGWKSYTKIRNLPCGCLWMFDQSVTADRNTRCEENAFVFPICIFAILTTLCRDSGILRAWRHGEERAHLLAYNTRLRKEHSGSSYVLLIVLCSHVLSARNVIWITWSSQRSCKALQNLEVIFLTTNAWRTSGEMNLQFIEELMASFQPCRNLAFGLRFTRLYGNFYTCFKMNIRSLGKGLLKTKTMAWDRKPSFKMLLDDKLVKGSWQSFQVWRQCAHYFYVHFHDSDYVMQKFGNSHAYDVIKKRQPMF